MSAVIVDSNVLIGYRLARDQHHEFASEIVSGFDTGVLPTAVLIDYCLAEVLNIVGERVGHRTGVETLDALIESRGVSLVQTTHDDWSTGQALYRRYDGLSFVDAITVAYMRRRQVEYIYSFDDDFDALDDITRLDTPDNPSA